MIKLGAINREDVGISWQKVEEGGGGGLYSSVAYTLVRLMLQCGLYSSAAYTPVRHIPWKIRQACKQVLTSLPLAQGFAQ